MGTAAPRALTLAEGREALKFCNSYTRLPTLVDLSWSLEWADWLKLLGEEWTLCDNIGIHADVLLDSTPFADVAYAPDGRDHLMNDEERAALAALAEEVTVWRGCYLSNKWGLSWSLDRETAAKFPTLHRYRQEGQPLLVKAKIRRADIIALKLERTETEIIAVRPKHVATSHIRS